MRCASTTGTRRTSTGSSSTRRCRRRPSLDEAVGTADVLVMGVPSHGMRDTAKELAPFLRPWVPVVSLSKGLEQGTRLRMTQVLEAELPGHPCGVLTGPNLAKEILAGDAAASVIAMDDPVIAEALQDVFAGEGFRVYTNPDVIGCEVAGALKNVMAIASGMADGLGTGDNTRAAVITRGLAELTRLGCAMGGHQVTFAGLAGMGDLIATCISPQSRNRYVGEQLGQGRTIDEIIEEMSMVAEGVKTSKVVMELAKEYGVRMPIAGRSTGWCTRGRPRPRPIGGCCPDPTCAPRCTACRTTDRMARVRRRPFDAWTTVGNLDSRARAMVDPSGRVAVAASGWLLDWWIGAEDRWHMPAEESAVRQQLVGSSPVVETRVRIPTGDAVSRGLRRSRPGRRGPGRGRAAERQQGAGRAGPGGARPRRGRSRRSAGAGGHGPRGGGRACGAPGSVARSRVVLDRGRRARCRCDRARR